MHNNLKNTLWLVILAALLAALLLTACAAQPTLDFVPLAPTPTVALVTQVATLVEPDPTATPAPTRTPAPTPTLAPTQAPLVLDCASAFEKREMAEPYQRYRDNAPRYTLSTEEVAGLFQQMGIQKMCIPAELGAPILNAQWDTANSAGMGPAERGFMISLGFEKLYRGAGWSDGFVVAATYDFRAPTEYETFSVPEDYDALRNGALPNRAIRTFAANGLTGFQRVAAGIGMGRTPLYMTYVVPFEQGYVAAVYSLGNFEGDLQPLMDQFSRGAYPEGAAKYANLFGAMAETIQK